MATQGHQIGTDWENLVDELSLTEGSNYLIQNVGASTVLLHESASEPAADAVGLLIQPGWDLEFEISTTEGLWARARRGAGSVLAVSDVV